MSGPRVSLLNLSETARIIDDMAFWRATDENQEIVFERYNEGLGAKLANAGMWCFGYGQLGTYALEDNVSQVKVTAEKIRREATQTMEKRMLDGPASVRQYLDHCVKMKELSWKNVDFKSKEVARLNDEVKAAMDSRLRRTRIAKTVATASFTVGLSFVSAPIIVLVGAGVAYSTSCQIAESVSDIDASEMFGTVAGPLIREGLTSTGVNHGQSAIEKRLAKSAQQQADDAMARHMRRINNYVAQNKGRKPTGKQGKAVRKSLWKVEKANAKAAVSNGRAKLVAGSFGAVIGLLLMKDELAKAAADARAEVNYMLAH